jgi:hypothetical protein
MLALTASGSVGQRSMIVAKPGSRGTLDHQYGREPMKRQQRRSWLRR